MPAVPSVRVTIFSRKMGAGAGGRFLPLPVQYFVNNSTLSGASVVVTHLGKVDLWLSQRDPHGL